MKTKTGELSIPGQRNRLLTSHCARCRTSSTAWPTRNMKYRQRYVDLITNEQTRFTFVPAQPHRRLDPQLHDRATASWKSKRR